MSESRDPLMDLSDPEQWGDPVPSSRRKSDKRRRGVVVSVRFTPEELALVEGRAQTRGLALGTYLRESALETSVVPKVEHAGATVVYISTADEFRAARSSRRLTVAP